MRIAPKTLLLGLAIVAGLAAPAEARTKTRLVDCAVGSCLLITGERADAAAPVSINGHAVATRGAHRWRASLPVETLRAWSAPYARSVTVAVADRESEARLPIGLLGHVENLAFLTISLK